MVRGTLSPRNTQTIMELAQSKRNVLTGDAAMQRRAEIILAWWQRSEAAPRSAEITGAWKQFIYVACINEDTGDKEEISIDTTGLRNEQLGDEISRRAERIKYNLANREYGRMVADAFESVFSKHPDLIREVYRASKPNASLPALLA